MSPPLLAELYHQGIRLHAEGANLRFRAPAGVVTAQVRACLLEHKPALLECLANPGKASRETWSTVVAEVADRWQVIASQCCARGEEPPWLAEALDLRLQAQVGEAIRHATDAETFTRAIAAIERWRVAWLALLDTPPEVAEPRTIETGGHPQPPNQSVHEMLDAARARDGWQEEQGRSITSWLQKRHAAIAGLWTGAPLEASWLDWRRKIGAEHIGLLDQAMQEIATWRTEKT